MAGRRQRYRIVNVDRLVKCLRMENAAAFREWHRHAVDELVRQEDWKRERFWSKAIAVGDREWLADLASARRLRRYEIVETEHAHYLQGR